MEFTIRINTIGADLTDDTNRNQDCRNRRPDVMLASYVLRIGLITMLRVCTECTICQLLSTVHNSAAVLDIGHDCSIPKYIPSS